MFFYLPHTSKKKFVYCYKISTEKEPAYLQILMQMNLLSAHQEIFFFILFLTKLFLAKKKNYLCGGNLNDQI